jgi:hypothetical protein
VRAIVCRAVAIVVLFSLGLSASGAMDTPEGRYVGIRFALGV